jgi:zinc protease
LTSRFDGSAEVTNKILGNMFTSRLNMNLREKHGYTYGAFSWFKYLRSPGPFLIGTDVASDQTGAAVRETFKEIVAMRVNQPTDAELKMAKDNMSLSLSGQFESWDMTIYNLNDLFVYGLPLDYYSALPGKINSVGAGDLAAIVSKYFKPLNMVVIAVGDKAKIEPQLKALNLGEIQELDSEANPIK